MFLGAHAFCFFLSVVRGRLYPITSLRLRYSYRHRFCPGTRTAHQTILHFPGTAGAWSTFLKARAFEGDLMFFNRPLGFLSWQSSHFSLQKGSCALCHRGWTQGNSVVLFY